VALSALAEATPNDIAAYMHGAFPPCHEALSAIAAATPADIVAFMHGSFFSPTLSALENALIHQWIHNVPGLTLDRLRKFPPHSKATVKGHLKQKQKNKQSTKKKKKSAAPSTTPSNGPNEDPSEPEMNTDTNPLPDSPSNARTHLCYAAIIDVRSPEGQIYSDQTGRLPVASIHGNNYIFVLYDYDSNHIFAEPIKSRHAKPIMDAYKRVHARLVQAGLRPQLQRLDNECSDILKEFMREQQVDFQLAPPGIHRCNAAERAIQTFKDHFIAGLCSVDKDFPMHLWDALVAQAVLTLNLLRGSRINPNLSAWAQIYGTFDYNRTPLAPPGVKVLAHDKADKRGSWSSHALDGWYIGPALESYRCYRIWLWETRATRICDTVSWFPEKLPMP
jgi:hypothetical protein